MVVAIILLLVAVGSVLFHIYSPWWWTPLASNWGYIDDTITLTFWITGAVFFAIVAFMAYCVFRFRHKEGRQATYNPENKKLEWWLSIGTAIGVAAMLAPGLVVWHQFVTVPADATEVEVMGQQWLWSYRLPGKDGRALSIGMVALVLSWLMRLQLGFPGTFSFIDPNEYLQFITMHGMIMVIYLLTALFLGGFGNYLIPLMVGARDMVF